MAEALFIPERHSGLNIITCHHTIIAGPIRITGMATRIIRIPSGTGDGDLGFRIVSIWDLEFRI